LFGKILFRLHKASIGTAQFLAYRIFWVKMHSFIRKFKDTLYSQHKF